LAIFTEKSRSDEFRNLKEKSIPVVADRWNDFNRILKFRDDVSLKDAIASFCFAAIAGLKHKEPKFQNSPHAILLLRIAPGPIESVFHSKEQMEGALGIAIPFEIQPGRLPHLAPSAGLTRRPGLNKRRILAAAGWTRRAQPLKVLGERFVEIIPVRVVLFNQIPFPSPRPELDVGLTLKGICHHIISLIPNQHLYTGALGEIQSPPLMMFKDSCG
jgi:hypothetical protein